jgi:hypothetical protein
MIDGEPEIRGHIPTSSFNPYAAPRAKPWGAPTVVLHPHRKHPPAIDMIEAFLVSVFLRRYVTYCARRKRYVAMQGAATLLREIQRGRA